jgi:hypothetical protein
MHFGLYLKKKGIITAEQLVDALELQHSELVRIGQLAIEEGILSARDVFKVLRCQSDLPNERFGEIAVELGLMTEDQLQHLLMVQSNRKPPLLDVLVDQGLLTPSDANSELANYRSAMERKNRVVTRRLPNPAPHVLPASISAQSCDADYFAMMI